MVEISIPLNVSENERFLHGELFIPKPVKGLIVFAHGSGSGRTSPRNRYVANVLNQNGFATLLIDLLSLEEQDSDMRSQEILEKYPTIMLNKFNIRLLATRLEIITTWLVENLSEVKDLPFGYFGSSTGAAAAIEASTCDSLKGKVTAIVSRGGRPDLADPESIKAAKASTLLIVGSKDSKTVIDLNKKALKQLSNVRTKDLVMIPNAGHTFEEENAMEQVADDAVKWFGYTL
jgi:dienelactone hydrolase